MKVLFYNQADADESFVAEVSEEDFALAQKQETSFSSELYAKVRQARIEMPAVCYYA